MNNNNSNKINQATTTRDNRGRKETYSISDKNNWTLQICAMIRQGISPKTACKKTGFTYSNFRYWRDILLGTHPQRRNDEVRNHYGIKFEQEGLLSLTKENTSIPLDSLVTTQVNTTTAAKPHSNGNGSSANGHNNNNSAPISKMKAEIKKANGTVYIVEGTPEELANLFQRLND